MNKKSRKQKKCRLKNTVYPPVQRAEVCGVAEEIHHESRKTNQIKVKNTGLPVPTQENKYADPEIKKGKKSAESIPRAEYGSRPELDQLVK